MNSAPETKGSARQLEAWLLSNTPTSRRHARLGSLYKGWLKLKSNKLAMLGLFILIALVVIAILAPIISPADPFEQNLGNPSETAGNRRPFSGHRFAGA